MSTSGYFVLGCSPGVRPSGRLLPTFTPDTVHSPLMMARNRGLWFLDSSLPRGEVINLPSRDKQVTVWTEYYAEFRDVLGRIDSELPDLNYADKLANLIHGMDGIVVNNARDTHGSMAIVFHSPLLVYGLHDAEEATSYLFWTTDPTRLSRMLQLRPLKYAVFRFPTRDTTILFLQAEAICFKWQRWLRSNPSVLQAFNALEHRFYGPP